MLSTLTQMVPSRPLGLVRVIIGLAALLRAFVALQVLAEISKPEIVHIPYVDWTPRPSIPIVAVVVVVWVAAAALFTLGWKVPWSGSALLLAIVATLALDQQAYSNHLYLMAWLVLLLVVADAGAGLSLGAADRPVVRWVILLPMIQLSIVYGFSGASKLNDEFLSGLVLAGVMQDGVLTFPQALWTPEFLSVMAVVVVGLELLLAVGIWITRLRPAVFVLGLSFHIAITLFMGNTMELFVFSLEMLALYPLFLTQEPLVVVWDDDCAACAGWVSRFERFDLLRTLQVVGKGNPSNPIPPGDVERSLHLIHQSETTSGFRAVTGVLEHLVPTLWFASVLRLPGASHLAERWYRWQAARRSCRVGLRAPASP